jgi:UDP-N-acetylglucosamine 2-epimerase (non-hydrolysing)
MRKKILIVIGARPDAIKIAPLYHILKKDNLNFNVKLCATGQHREMLDQVLNVFNIKPDFDLKIMRPNQDLTDINIKVLFGMKKILISERPDIVIVHGDTSTAFAAALASFYRGIMVGHVEAGLRTNNIFAPFPEEINRQFIGRIATLHFAPTKISAKNLKLEGIKSKFITVTGNTVIDSLFWVIRKLDSDSKKLNNIFKTLNKKLKFDLRCQPYILITGHRRENFGKAFNQITEAILELAKRFPKIFFVYALHLNPSVESHIRRVLSNINNIKLIPPQEYESFIILLRYCFIVLSDSGGIQEEAPSLGKPVLVMREATERPEGINAGTLKLVGTSKNLIVRGVLKLIKNRKVYNQMSRAVNPYGDGEACKRILQVLKRIKIIK